MTLLCIHIKIWNCMSSETLLLNCDTLKSFSRLVTRYHHHGLADSNSSLHCLQLLFFMQNILFPISHWMKNQSAANQQLYLQATGWLAAPVPTVCTVYLYLPPPLWGWKQQFLRNVGTYLPKDMPTHPRSLSTSIAGLLESCPIQLSYVHVTQVMFSPFHTAAQHLIICVPNAGNALHCSSS